MTATTKMKCLLQKVKANLILQHDEDDNLLLGFIAAAISYAESYQHRSECYYSKRGKRMSATTEQAIIMLSSHFYESRDGSTGGFFADNVQAGQRKRDMGTAQADARRQGQSAIRTIPRL